MMNMFPAYGIVDVKHGVEHRYVLHEEQARKEYGDDIVTLTLTAEPFDYLVAHTYVCRLTTRDEVICFLDAIPEYDLDDPTPVDLAEYSLWCDADEGITRTIAEFVGMTDVLDRTKTDPRLSELVRSGYPEDELYNEVIRTSDLRFGEIMDILEIGTFQDVLRRAT